MAMDHEEEEAEGEGEGGMRGDSAFASLMPDLLRIVHRSDDRDSISTEKGFQELHRLLTEAETREEIQNTRKLSNHPSKDVSRIFREERLLDNAIEKGEPDFEKLYNLPYMNCLLNEERAVDEVMKKGSREFMKPNDDVDDDETVAERSQKKESDDFTSGKENIGPQKNKFSRREKSSRISANLNPFTVDLRSFGSVLDCDGVTGWGQPQDIDELWEVADEKASEAVMRRLRGQSCKPNDVNVATSSSQRIRSRRKNSQRTIRSKWFSEEIPLCAENLQSLDDEVLEEECENNSSSFTFISGCEKIQENLTNNNDEFHANEFSSVMESDELSVDVRAEDELNGRSKQPQNMDIMQNIDIADKEIHAEKNTDDDADQIDKIGAEDDHVILSHCKLSAIDANWDNACSNSRETKALATKDEMEASKQLEGLKIEQIIYGEIHVKNVTANDANDNVGITNTAPAADENCISDADEDDKNKIDGDVNDINRQVTPCYRSTALKTTSFTSPMPPSNPIAVFSSVSKDARRETTGKRKLEADFDGTIDPPIDMSMVLDTCAEASCPPIVAKTHLISENSIVQEKDVNLAKEINFIASAERNTNKEQNKKPYKPRNKNLVMNQRDSLEGAGTKWKGGVRRSTRIKSRPLEWWRGERFLMGRIHRSRISQL